MSEPSLLPKPPELPHRWDGGARALALVLALATLPAIALVHGGVSQQTKTSVLHVAVSFVALTLAFRIIGKRELGRLSPLELVTLMLIPEILSNSVQGQSSMLTGLAGLCTILFLVVATSLLSQRFKKVRDVLEAPPTVLVVNGKLLTEAMNRERISSDELASEMRKQGVEGLEAVRFAVLESGGNITFVARPRPREERDEQ